MKQKYVVFQKFNGSFGGWVSVNKNGTTFLDWDKHFASRFTLKQASKLCFNKNKELRDSFSFATIYGYEPE